MENNTNKGMNLLQKLFRYRLKIDRKGTPIVNLSSLFSIACLIFAPHMSIAGIILALVLGYHISLESEGDTGDLEETVRAAAEKVRLTASAAAKTIRQEIDRSKSPAAPKEEAEVPAAKQEAAPAVHVPAENPAASAKEIVEDLKYHMDTEIPQGNPAEIPGGIPTPYHTAFSAAGGSVPILRVETEDQSGTDYQPPRTNAQQ